MYYVPITEIARGGRAEDSREVNFRERLGLGLRI